MIKIIIAQDFSDAPGGRLRSEGDFSGEEFRESILEKKFEQTLESDDTLLVDLDGGYGYAPSFLEEAFGGLARKYGFQKVLNYIDIKTDDEPSLKQEIMDYIKNSNK